MREDEEVAELNRHDRRRTKGILLNRRNFAEPTTLTDTTNDLVVNNHLNLTATEGKKIHEQARHRVRTESMRTYHVITTGVSLLFSVH